MRGALYVESSALARIAFERDMLLRARIAEASRRLTSALTETEARRALLRAHLDRRLHAGELREGEIRLRSFFQDCEIAAVSDEILMRAAQAFPVEPVRTLDAIHLASAIHFEHIVGTLTMVSCDDRVRDNARAFGWKVLPT